MKFSDPKNVQDKANRMLKFHLELFSKYLGEYRKNGEHYYFYDRENESLRVDYEYNSKLLTKVFTISMKMSHFDVEFKNSFHIKTSFMGSRKIEGVIFKGYDAESRKVADIFNRDSHFFKSLLNEIKNIDIANIIIEYNEHSKILQATINPYAGAFVWIKLPPVYHDVRLKEEEIKAMCNIKEIVDQFFKNEFLHNGESRHLA